MSGSLAFAAVGRPRLSEPVSERATQAAESLRRARAAGAQEAAPMTHALAWEVYAEGLRHARRQEDRPAWLRDFALAAEAFDRTVRLAEGSERVALGHGRRAAGEVQRSIARARRALGPLSGVEDVVWIARPERSRLQRARQLLETAVALGESGAHAAAATRARESEALVLPIRRSLLESTSRFSDPASIRVWRGWVDATVRWSRETGRVAVVVLKDEHRVMVYENGRLKRTYRAELGWNNVGDKRVRGDGATPEGRYFVTQKKGRGASRYHRALLVDYPNRDDLERLAEMKRAGVVDRRTQAGGLIELHGEGGRGDDWTDGCVALTNAEIEELFGLVAVGTPVTIVGSLSGTGVFGAVAARLVQ